MVQIEKSLGIEEKGVKKMFLTELFKKNPVQHDTQSIIDLKTLCPDCSNSDKYMKRCDETGCMIISCAICNHEFEKT